MLKILRKKGFAKKIIWAIAIVIIFSFGFFGTAYLITGNSTTNYAGKIYGKKISIDDFNKFYRNTRIQAIRQYGANLEKVAHLINLEAQTWDRLILLHESKKRKIKVSNREIVRAIESDQTFGNNGRFDILIYNAILRNLQIRPRDYEENVRDNLKISELYAQVTSSVTINEEEVFNAYKERNEKAQVSYVFVDSNSFEEGISPSIAEIEQYYLEHKSEFSVPPSINVQYLTFDYPQSDEQGEDGKAELADNREQDNIIQKEKELAEERAEDIFQQLLVNPNMEEIAKLNNMTMKRSGFFSMEQPNLTLGWSYDLLNQIFKMDLNEVNEPFETADGLSIIQIREKRDNYVPEFSEAVDQVRKAVTLVKSKEIAQKKAVEHLEAIKEELNKSKLRDFAKSAKSLGLEIHQTPEFTRGQYLPQVGLSKEFEETAFLLTEDNKLSNVIEIEKGYCILHLDNYVSVDMSEYDKAKNELAQSISNEKQAAVFGDFVAQLRVNSGLIDNIAQLRAQPAQ